jgi:hypothetical protein
MKQPPTTTRACIPYPSVVALADPLTVATLNPVTMESLQLFRGDTIIVRFVVDLLTVRFMSYALHQGEEAAGHCPYLSELR